MKLYDGGKAPNPRRVSIFLKEKSIALDTIPIDMGALEHKGTDFSAINPLQTLPVLALDNGVVLSETMAICRYLEALYPEPPLLGVTALEQAQIEMWQRRIEFGLLMPVGQAFRHIHPAMQAWEVPQFADWGAANKTKALKFCEFLDSELAKRDYIAGDDFSVADITAIVACDFMKPARIIVPETMTHLTDYIQRMRARETMR